MKRQSWLVIVPITLVMLSTQVSAQTQSSGQILGQAGINYNIPTGDFAEDSGADAGYAESGIGFSVAGQYLINDQLAIFGEYSFPKFGLDIEDSSQSFSILGAGIKYFFSSGSDMKPFLQVGIASYKGEVETSVSGVNVSVESDPGIGINFGGGVILPIGGFQVDISARLHSIELEYDVGGLSDEEKASWIGLTAMLSIPLGG